MPNLFFSIGQPIKRALSAVCAALAFLSLLMISELPFHSEGLARETYVQFAKRMGGKAPSGSTFRPDLERQLVAEANRFRASKKQKRLTPSGEFQLAARAHAADMAVNDFVGHRSSQGAEFSSRMSALMGGGMLMMPHMAENAARDSQKGEANAAKASRLFQQWVDSRPHRKALLNSGFNYVSTGVVQRGNKIYAVQIFWNQLPSGVKVVGAKAGSTDAGEGQLPEEAPTGDEQGSLY